MRPQGRREFLATCIAQGTGLYATGILGALAVPNLAQAAVAGRAEAPGTGEEALQHTATSLDIVSAHAVTTGFLATLGTSVVNNGGQLSLTHASVVSGLEVARLIALSLGSDSDRHKATEEIAEMAIDSAPALAMIAASDFAERGIALEPSVMAGRLRENGHLRIAEDERLVSERPELSLDTQTKWEEHQLRVMMRLTDRVAQMIAITSLAAPFATTLTSAAFWKDGFDDVAHLCTELALARQVLASIAKKTDPAKALPQIKDQAAKDATEMLNGPWGYNQLGIMIACNAQGLFGVGTPPNLWYASNHLLRDPIGCARSEAKGFLLSETQTLIAASAWLAIVTGSDLFSTCRKVAANQYRMLGVIKKSFSEPELRAASLGDGRKLAARILPILHRKPGASVEETIRQIKDEVENTPTPALQLSLGEWIDRMRSVSERIIRRFPVTRQQVGDIPDMSAEELDNIEKLKQGEFHQSLLKAMSEENRSAVHGHLEKFQRWRQNRLAQRIAVVLHAIAGDSKGDEHKIDDFIKGFGLNSDLQFERETFSSLDDEHSRAVASEIRILSRAMGQVVSFKGTHDRFEAAKRLYSEGADVDSILSQLGYIHRETLKQACDMLVNIGVPLENIVANLQAADGGQKSEKNPHELVYSGSLPARITQWMADSWEDSRNLSESTRDIIRVIATQLPAIPAFKISFTELMKKMVNVESGASITESQLGRILQIFPAIGYGVAALADNAPGYLILEKVVTGLFLQTFPNETLDAIPHLRARLGLVCRVIASQSGMTFPFSSATNLLQNHIEIVPTDAPGYPQGFGIKRTKLTTGDTVSSRYMQLSAATTIAWATIELGQILAQASRIHQGVAAPAKSEHAAYLLTAGSARA